MSEHSYRTDRPGTLPQDTEPVVNSLRLPAGRLIFPDTNSTADASMTPVLWMTDDRVEAVASFWAPLAAQFPSIGLWPVVLDSLRGQEERPWLRGELNPTSSSDPAGEDAKDVLDSWWRRSVPLGEDEEEVEEIIGPFGEQFPGLAPAERVITSPNAPELVAAELTGRLGLVAVTRPADVLATVGWRGPVNFFDNMGMLSCVLRSWEDRFGAFLVGVGFDTLALAVRRPPSTLEAATFLAAEHLAVCPDNIYQGEGSIRDYAEVLVDAPAWEFWWD